MTFPKEHLVKFHSTNPSEGLNGATLMKQSDEWVLQRARYITLEMMALVSDNPTVMLPAVPGA